jgi:glucosamine--fructose-6-phosphate aminotransferase (isomerizing)
MCGVIGYVGSQPAWEVLLSGLQRLEYRGYDSAGVATLDGRGIELRRTVGRVQVLSDLVLAQPVRGNIGIAHTRWATHGRPSEANAHPHLDQSVKIAVVHNGIVENHAVVRTFLEEQGVTFRSETDTEALVQLIGFFYQQMGDLLQSVRSALREVHGTFGIVVLCEDTPSTLIAARRGSPLIVGLGDDEFIVSSDASAIVAHAKQVIYLNDNEMIVVGSGGVQVTTLDAVPVEKSVELLDMQLEELDLVGYEYHMLKEIYEQPDTLRNVMRGRVHAERGELTLGGLDPVRRQLPHCRRALLFGCGTSWHAGLIGEYLFEELAELPTTTQCASELRYRNPIIEEGTMAIAISQSGETADTLAALREVRDRGAVALGLVNVVGSSIARETDAGIYLHVGPEIGVASTKAFTGQVAALAMLAAYLGRRRHLSSERMNAFLAELSAVPEKAERILEQTDRIKQLAHGLTEWDNCLYLGRGVNYPVALEGALKLKELSYIHAEGLPAAEMKHGPIAMIDPGMPVVFIAPRDHTYDKILTNMEEVRSRGGHLIAIATEGDRGIVQIAHDVVFVPETMPLLTPLLTTIPLQLLAYHAALLRGYDVDKPRNLAKSVTVE